MKDILTTWRLFSIFSLILISFPARASHVTDHFMVFDSREEAIEWYKGEPGCNSHGQILEANNPLYEIAQKSSDLAWVAFKQVYEVETSNLPAPYVILTDNESADGLIEIEQSSGLTALAVITHSGVFSEDQMQIAQFRYWAHEFGHLIFDLTFVPTYYFVNNGSELLGLLQPNDQRAKEIATKWIKLTKLPGYLPLKEFNNVPVFFNDTGLLMLSWWFAIKAESSPVECQKAVQVLMDLMGILKKSYSFCEQHFDEFSIDSLQAIDEKSRNFIDLSRQCFYNKKIDVFEVLYSNFGISSSEIISQSGLTNSEIELLSAAGIDELLLFTQDRYTKMRQLLEEQDLTKIRVYTEEEHVDDASTKTLKFMGYSKEEVLQSYLSLIPFADEAKKCSEIIAEGKVPYYGALSDPHHSPCYRAYHALIYYMY